MASKTIVDFRNAVLSELSEAANSALAALPSGQGTNGFAIDRGPGMLTLINQAKDELAKRALPVACVATRTVAAGAGPAFALMGFSASNIKAMRNAESVAFTPNGGAKRLLTRMSPDALNAFYYDRETASAAPAQYWSYAKYDPRSIEFNRKLDTAGTITVQGYGIPADAAADGDTFPWLNADDERAIVLYAAVMLTQRASEDPRLGMMRALLAPQLDAVMLGIRNRVSAAFQASYLDVYVPFASAGVTANAG